MDRLENPGELHSEIQYFKIGISKIFIRNCAWKPAFLKSSHITTVYNNIVIDIQTVLYCFTIQKSVVNNDIPDDGGGGEEEYYLVDSPDSDSKVDILYYSKNEMSEPPFK